jgi:hypothetical protein
VVAVAAVCAAAIAFATNPPKGGTISEEDKRKLADVVSEYYLNADPANKGTLKIYNIKKFGSSYLVLTQKYRGEGESFSVLFLADSGFNIVAKAPGDIPISPCFSANVVKYQGKSIVYGNFKNKKWNPQTDLVTNVQIDFIKITFEDGTYVREQVSMDKGYIVVVDTLSNIRNIEVYNSKGELQSDLINESACSEYDFIDVIGEKSSDRITSLIEENLAAIMSSPENSSNPQDYINAHQAEYNAILALETQALPYLFTEFEKGGQTGLKGYIMQNLCWDILGEDNIQYASKDPQDWYDTFKEHVQRTAASSTLDFVKANNPKYGALLDVINTPGAERIAKFVEENRFQEVLTSLQSIPQEKIAFCLFEVDTWNIPEEDLISKPKPYSAYFFDSDDEVLYLLHEKDYLKKDEKMLCAFRCNEAKDVYKSEDSILTIEQEFGGQINNELYYARIPDLDKISLELLENELLKVKYSNQEKIINKNDSLNDELLLIVDDKEYKIKITIKNFGLIDKTQIKTRHPLE